MIRSARGEDAGPLDATVLRAREEGARTLTLRGLFYLESASVDDVLMSPDLTAPLPPRPRHP